MTRASGSFNGVCKLDLLFILLIDFLVAPCGPGDLSSPARVSAVDARRLSHWTTREALSWTCFGVPRKKQTIFALISTTNMMKKLGLREAGKVPVLTQPERQSWELNPGLLTPAVFPAHIGCFVFIEWLAVVPGTQEVLWSSQSEQLSSAGWARRWALAHRTQGSAPGLVAAWAQTRPRGSFLPSGLFPGAFPVGSEVRAGASLGQGLL